MTKPKQLYGRPLAGEWMMDRNYVLKQLGGSVEEIARDLSSFATSARALSDDHPRLIDAYPQKWVAIFKGEVKAVGDSRDDVAKSAVAAGVPPQQTIIRFIDRSQKTLFL